AFWQIAELSKAPLIDSHSGCRHFTPGMERNSSDEMIRKLAEGGGVIQINFGSMFINAEVSQKAKVAWEHFAAYAKQHGLRWPDAEFKRYRERYLEENPVGIADIGEVADHIDHVVRVAGIDHVGLGSDFDGISHVPVGLEDVSGYPHLIRVLLERGYSEEDLRKICSGNVLRVMREVERVARELSAGEKGDAR
ncbi:MAG: membrane dipeptidase, partial [Acidobacteriota bacterium]